MRVIAPDMKVAFVQVQDPGAPVKRKTTGIDGNALQLLQSFLIPRRIVEFVKAQYPSSRTIPQEFPSCVINYLIIMSEVRLFSDDCTMFNCNHQMKTSFARNDKLAA